MLRAHRVFPRFFVAAGAAMTPFIDGVRHDRVVHSNLGGLSQRRLKTGASLSARIWFVQSISVFRILTILIFASLALSSVSPMLLILLYAVAMVSDLLDGYLARRLDVATYFGKVMDLVADKSLTVISLLYAAERGVSLLPLALIAARDIAMIGMRLVTIDGKQLLPTNRSFGGVMAFLVGCNTLVLVYSHADGFLSVANRIYWALSLIVAINLLARLRSSAAQIKLVSLGNWSSETRATSRHSDCKCNRRAIGSAVNTAPDETQY